MTKRYDADAGQVLRQDDRRAVAALREGRWTPTPDASPLERQVLAEAPAGWPPEIVADALDLAHAFGLR